MSFNKFTAVRRLQFCAGHRVHKHESKCNNMHGHNYVIYFHARASETMAILGGELDKLGRVIDFSVLKAKMNNWIQTHWDHGFIYYENDIELDRIFKVRDGELMSGDLSTHKSYKMPYNPTAENMAYYLLHKICPKEFKDTDVEIYKIVLWETENCFAEVSL